jgi:hypothetical protein
MLQNTFFETMNFQEKARENDLAQNFHENKAPSSPYPLTIVGYQYMISMPIPDLFRYPVNFDRPPFREK